MAKNLPYFKFFSAEWLTGDIVYEDLETQGLFINICAIYWHRDGIISIKDIEKRYKSERLANLTERFIWVNSDGFISIKFLDEQLKELGHKSEVNSINGKKGGRPKSQHTDSEGEKPTAFSSVSDLKANQSHIEEELDKEKDVDEDVEGKNTPPPPLDEKKEINSRDCQESTNKLKEDQIMIEVMAKNHFKEIADIPILIDRFILDQSAISKKWDNFSDMKRHFTNWLPKYLTGIKSSSPTKSTNKKTIY